jgi:hypothetical protein
VRHPHVAVNPDRHARRGQRLDPAFALARRGLVRDQPDINPAFLRADQRLDDPRASCQPISADQDFALGVVDGADSEGGAVLLRGKANRDGRARGYLPTRLAG